MQLDSRARKKHKRVALSLAAATCSLLGASSGRSIASEQPRAWSFDTAVLYYGETDRVTDASANIRATRNFANGQRLSFKFSVDSLTGASANGAVPGTGAQTFTSPSGNQAYTTPAGQTPLDPTFLDTRVALSGSWDRPVGQRFRTNLGLSYSQEYDYTHIGINAGLTRDFNQRNTTLNLGVAFSSDQIDPVGGTPIGLSAMRPVGFLDNRLGDESKTVTDLMIGVSHVLGRRSIGALNYSVSQASGYLSDPYKLISVVDPVTGDPTPGAGTPGLYLFESRPDSRTKHSLFAQWKHRLLRDIVDLSYRFMTDDWGVQSHTMDFRYRWRLGKSYVQPHLRLYTQTAADFYRRVLIDGDPVPQHASADYRLGEFDAFTVGFKYGRPHGDNNEWSARIEYYSQSGRSPPEAQVGALAGLDLFPGVDAVIAQFGYRF